MREATKEEKESVIEYVESISVDTDINFYAIQQGGESMDMIDFDKMTEEIEEVANKYGLTIDFGKGTIGQETEITLKLRKAV